MIHGTSVHDSIANTPAGTFAAGWNRRCNTGADDRAESKDWREGWQKCDQAFKFGERPTKFNVSR